MDSGSALTIGLTDIGSTGTRIMCFDCLISLRILISSVMELVTTLHWMVR